MLQLMGSQRVGNNGAKNIIHKTAGKRYVYRFVCDLQSLLGYTPEELHAMLDVKPDADE